MEARLEMQKYHDLSFKIWLLFLFRVRSERDIQRDAKGFLNPSEALSSFCNINILWDAQVAHIIILWYVPASTMVVNHIGKL